MYNFDTIILRSTHHPMEWEKRFDKLKQKKMVERWRNSYALSNQKKKTIWLLWPAFRARIVTRTFGIFRGGRRERRFGLSSPSLSFLFLFFYRVSLSLSIFAFFVPVNKHRKSAVKHHPRGDDARCNKAETQSYRWRSKALVYVLVALPALSAPWVFREKKERKNRGNIGRKTKRCNMGGVFLFVFVCLFFFASFYSSYSSFLFALSFVCFVCFLFCFRFFCFSSSSHFRFFFFFIIIFFVFFLFCSFTSVVFPAFLLSARFRLPILTHRTKLL